MYTFLLVLLILDSLVLIAAILLQSGKGSGLAANFGGASSTAEVIGSRQAGNLLTKTSWWAGGIFIGLSFILQIAGSRSRTPSSVLDRAVSAPATAPAAPSSAAPAVPLTPAPTPAAPAGGAPAGTPPAPRP